VIDANNKEAARIACLKAIADTLEQAVPMEPPPGSDELDTLAKKAFDDR